MFLVTFLLPFPPFVKFFQKAEGKKMLFFFLHSKHRKTEKKERQQTVDLSLTCWYYFMVWESCLADILAFSLSRPGSRVTNPWKHHFSFWIVSLSPEAKENSLCLLCDDEEVKQLVWIRKPDHTMRKRLDVWPSVQTWQITPNNVALRVI